jgi:hypothetical protein
LVFVLALGATYACAKEYQAKKRVGEWEIEIRMNRDPPILGDNHITIEIRDGGGKRVKDAKVLVNYYMPPMPRMAPMNYIIPAEADRTSYRATLDFVMSGPWVIAVKISSAGKTKTAKFHIDVP